MSHMTWPSIHRPLVNHAHTAPYPHHLTHAGEPESLSLWYWVQAKHKFCYLILGHSCPLPKWKVRYHNFNHSIAQLFGFVWVPTITTELTQSQWDSWCPPYQAWALWVHWHHLHILLEAHIHIVNQLVRLQWTLHCRTNHSATMGVQATYINWKHHYT